MKVIIDPDNDHAMLRALADDNTRDPVGDLAVAVVDAIHRDLDSGIPWHDQQIINTAEEVIRESILASAPELLDVLKRLLKRTVEANQDYEATTVAAQTIARVEGRTA